MKYSVPDIFVYLYPPMCREFDIIVINIHKNFSFLVERNVVSRQHKDALQKIVDSLYKKQQTI